MNKEKYRVRVKKKVENFHIIFKCDLTHHGRSVSFGGHRTKTFCQSQRKHNYIEILGYFHKHF